MNKIGIFLETALNKTFVSIYRDNDILLTKYSILDFKSDNTYVYDIDLMLKRFSIEPLSINEVIVVNGPGYFTGIRSGVIIAKALFYALKPKVLLVDSFLFLRKCISCSNDCAIVISASKRDCFIGYFRGFNRIEDAILPIDELSNLSKEFTYFTDSPLISSRFSIELIEPRPILEFELESVKTIDEIIPFYMRSEESLFRIK